MLTARRNFAFGILTLHRVDWKDSGAVYKMVTPNQGPCYLWIYDAWRQEVLARTQAAKSLGRLRGCLGNFRNFARRRTGHACKLGDVTRKGLRRSATFRRRLWPPTGANNTRPKLILYQHLIACGKPSALASSPVVLQVLRQFW